MCAYRTGCFLPADRNAGVELILQESIRVNEPPDNNNEGIVVSVDTTVQEKNITYSTDDKLYKKIITKCWKIADKEKIDLRQSNTKTFKSSAMNNGSREQNMVQKQLGKLISYYYSESTSSQLIKMLSLKIVSYRNSKSESITSIF